MSHSPFFQTSVFRLTVSSALMLAATAASAGAFQLWEENAGSLGNNHAGAAAEANSAADEFYNPAGIVRAKHPEISVGGDPVATSVAYMGAVNQGGAGTPKYAKSEKGGDFKVIPNVHVVLPLGHKMYFSFGVTTPFGLATDFTGDPVTQYSGTETQILTINLNPSLAYAISSRWSVGVGLDAMYGSADYDSILNVGGQPYPFDNHLTGSGYGYNVGLLYQSSRHTRLGLSYRSRLNIDASGPSTIKGVSGVDPNDPSVLQTASATLPLPATTMLSYFHDMNSKWSVMASAFYSQWNVFRSVTLNNVANGQGAFGIPKNIVDNKDFRNTWNFAVGSDYKISKRWTMKFGLGYDQTPTRDGYRDTRMPDGNHTTVSVGARVQLNNRATLDLGYAHVFVPKVNVDNSKSSFSRIISDKGTANGNANLFGLQLTWVFS